MTRRSAGVFVLIGVALATAVLVLAFTAVFRHGFSARDHPGLLETFIAQRLRRLAFPRAASGVQNPVRETPEALVEARAHFADHCATCHANDGSGDTDIGQHLYPPAPDMRKPATQSLTDAELFYIIHNGIRFTGMPAWGGENSEEDQETWQLVHFIRHLPEITPVEITAMKKMNPKSRHELDEEEEIQKFLRGEEGAAPPSPHH